MTWAKKYLNAQAICTNKVNQLAHARYLPDAEAVFSHMMKHASILRPKFEACQKVLDEELGFDDLWHWTSPKGGYFVSFYAMPGTATKVVAMCKEAGVALTPAGASYPYGKDPSDSNIRLAPSFDTVVVLENIYDMSTEEEVASGVQTEDIRVLSHEDLNNKDQSLAVTDIPMSGEILSGKTVIGLIVFVVSAGAGAYVITGEIKRKRIRRKE